MTIDGRCHCGNVTFTLRWPEDRPTIPARVCTCSFCSRHGAAWTSAPDATLRIEVTRAELVSAYAFGTETAQFHVCARCGVVPVATCTIGERLFAVVNVNTFEGVDRALLVPTTVEHQAETRKARLERRGRAWIADVTYVEHAG